MSHTVQHELVYSGTTVEQVVAMLRTPSFREAVCDTQKRLVGREVAVSGDRITVDQRHSSDGVPGFMKRFVGEELRIVQDEHWTTPTHADITVQIPGKPGDIRGTADVAQVGDDVVERVVLDVTVNIPLIGGKIASAIGDKLVRTLDAEHEVGRRWLAEGS